MSDMKENLPSCGSNFMMLPEYLHSLFIRYIKNGRVRAPPEQELGELIQTFQQGAKTDRRALQSKFKSWARRMDVENENLKLSSTGKIIIPKEKCDNLVISIHSEKHIAVDKVIHKIQEKYTWTRKNFGMDREIVIDTISNKCANEECRKKLGISARTSFYQRPSYPMPHPILFGAPPFYNWQSPFVLKTLFSSNMNDFQSPFYTEKCLPMEKHYSMLNFMDPLQKNAPIFQQTGLQYTFPNMNETSFRNQTNLIKTPSTSTPNQNEPVFTRPFSKYCGIKKPKSIHEYNALMKASERYPEAYPSILKHQKTKFLAAFGLVPKGLCSSKTLRKFRRECKRRRIVEERCVRFLEHKTLRDRNKLNKRSFHEPHRNSACYLKAGGYSKTPLRSMSILASKRVKQNCLERFNNSEGVKRISARNFGGEIKRKINFIKERSPEVIDIASGDEEEKQKKSCQSELRTESDWKGNQEQKSVQSPNCSSNQEELSYPFSETLPLHGKVSMGNFKNQANSNYQNSVEDSNVLQSERSSMLKGRDFQQYPLQPYLVSISDSENIAAMSPTNQGQNKIIPETAKSVSFNNYHPHKENLLSKPAHNLPVPRQFIPIILKHDKSIPVSNQKDTSSVAHPYPIRQSPSETKMLLVDRLPKGAIVIFPSYGQQILPKGLNVSKVSPAYRPIAPRQTISQIITTPSNITPESESLNKDKEEVENKEKKGNGNFQRKTEFSGVKQKDNIDEEMRKLLSWIRAMKLNMQPQMFNRGVEKASQRLASQINFGISLIREVRRALLKIEKYEYVRLVDEMR
ncbi:uncharacterized protein LOC118182503 [Stegodyphus dumicola]|uniref:uncharacterized protein LOC118182503 n=1 Tax=Stegodyphus dumicola TaxID=202533 RepID=UPI0015AE2046|nr:uncharacterized protein LOC118182503 [Stegodyphus dumicola]